MLISLSFWSSILNEMESILVDRSSAIGLSWGFFISSWSSEKSNMKSMSKEGLVDACLIYSRHSLTLRYFPRCGRCSPLLSAFFSSSMALLFYPSKSTLKITWKFVSNSSSAIFMSKNFVMNKKPAKIDLSPVFSNYSTSKGRVLLLNFLDGKFFFW